jgi:hypothetical protein
MNTPAHVAASLFLWRKEPGWSGAAAVTIGAIIPDAPMFGFYAYQKLSGQSENEIWTHLYFDEQWQLLFDFFNSIPIFLALIAVFYIAGFRWGALLAGSALLHLFCDFPLHHDDAHRHFLPFISWRFESPVSYWDPNHHGRMVMWLELGLATAACLFVGVTSPQLPMRVFAWATFAIYAAFIIFAMMVWM